MRCPSCGAGNSRGNQACAGCGHLLPAPASPVSLQKPAPDASEAPSAAPGAAASIVDYKPSGLMGAGAIPLLAVAAIVSGIGAGWLYYLIAPSFNYLLASQAYVGLIVGAALYGAVRVAKVRRPRLAIGFALLGALLSYGTFEGLRSMKMRARAIDYVAAEARREMPPAQAQAIAEAAVPGPARFFPMYMGMMAKSGSTLESSSSGSSAKTGITVAGGWFWALLAFEILMVCAVACAMAQAAAASPFCEGCNAWYKTRAVLKAHPEQAGLLLEHAQSGRWDTMGEVPRLSSRGKKPNGENHADVSLTHCAGCSDGWATLSSTANKTTHTLAKSRLEPQMVAQMAAWAKK